MSDEPEKAAENGDSGAKRRWRYGLEELIALSAFLVSLASISIAYEESRATKRLVQANSLPYLSLTSTFDRGPKANATSVTRTLENDGVGPADVRFVSVRFNGHDYGDVDALLRDCCGITQPHTTATLTNRMIRPGTTVDFLVLKDQPGEEAGIDRYAQLALAGRLPMTVCYCSVFDECWALRSAGNGRPVSVGVCPMPRSASNNL